MQQPCVHQTDRAGRSGTGHRFGLTFSGRGIIDRAGKNAIMPTINRLSDKPYRWEIGSADLADVANVEKMMPLDFISADGFGITDKCRDYLYPLIQGEAYPDYDDRGMPKYVVMKNILVERKLESFEI